MDSLGAVPIWWASALALINLLGGAGIAKAAITFQNVTTTAGPFHIGESYGAAWGDLNGDGRPDLHLSHHRHRDQIFRNNGNGTFSDVTLLVDTSGTWIAKPFADTHGGAWADFDRDGDQDLYASNGVCCPGYFFVNEGGQFTEQAALYGIADDNGGRLPSWFDFNDDGRMDLLMSTHAPSRLWRQQTKATPPFLTFSNQASASQANMNCQKEQYAQFSDLNDDARIEVICVSVNGTFPDRIYDTSTFPFTNITTIVPSLGANDTVSGDFDGDLRTDLFSVRGVLRPSEVLKIGNTRTEASLNPGGSKEQGFRFTGSGPITISVATIHLIVSEIFIGSGGSHPPSSYSQTKTFTLDPLNSTTHGINSHDPAVNQGLYVGLVNPATQEWQILLSPGGVTIQVYLTVTGSSFSEPSSIVGIGGADLPFKPKLFLNTATGFQDATTAQGFTTGLSCASAAAADFDNDRDLDLFLVCRGGAQNLPDRLFEYKPDPITKKFVEVANAGGAQGIVGRGLGFGTGDSVTVADYNLDGFPDFFVTNGLNLMPARVGGPDQLFRNTSNGNNNHWILLQLKGKPDGTRSNADAVGATVYATAGGVTQLREQNGGYHRWSQNHSHVHFGLGGSTTVELDVRWPRGQLDSFTVSADRLYQVTEGESSGNGTIEAVVLDDVPPFPPLQSGDECGKPFYDRKLDKGLFLWKDCGTGVWSLRASPGGSATTVTYEGDLSSDQPFTSVTPFSIEGGDILNHTTPPPLVHYRFKVANTAEDGFDFTFPAGANVCLSVATLSGAQVLVGPRHKIAPLPFNLKTLKACGAP